MLRCFRCTQSSASDSITNTTHHSALRILSVLVLRTKVAQEDARGWDNQRGREELRPSCIGIIQRYQSL